MRSRKLRQIEAELAELDRQEEDFLTRGMDAWADVFAMKTLFSLFVLVCRVLTDAILES